MDPIADLQAQIVALRTATEGVWLSLLLSGGGDAVGHAQRLRRDTLQALRTLVPSDDQSAAMRDAVVGHSDQLWRRIVLQLGGTITDLA